MRFAAYTMLAAVSVPSVQITAMKYSMARTQKEVDDCMSMLKVSEFIKSESDEVEKITLIEQICE